jgi:hypothetical protein
MELITNKELKDILEKALSKLYENDSFLLENNCHERSITHKLAEYLQQYLPNYHVDCEYNFDIDNDNKRKKWISNIVIEKIILEIENTKIKLNSENPNLSDEIEKLEKSFYPDIIVHMRGSNDFNRLVIEAKKGKANCDLDIEKLKALTKRDGENHYRYQLGAQISFNIESDFDKINFSKPIYFINGSEE